MTKNCIRCNAQFEPKHYTRKFCSDKCRLATSNERYRNKDHSELLKRGFFCWSEYKDKTVIV